MYHLHHQAAISFFAAKADLIKIFRWGSPQLKEAIVYLLRRAAESIRQK